MNCPNCNAPLKEGAKFCTTCGASVVAITSAPVNVSPVSAPPVNEQPVNVSPVSAPPVNEQPVSVPPVNEPPVNNMQAGNYIINNQQPTPAPGDSFNDKIYNGPVKKAPKKKKSVGKIIALISVLTVLLAAGIIFLIIKLNPVNRAMGFIKEGKFKEAVSIYKEKIRGTEKTKDFSNELYKYAKSVKDDFYNEKIKYDKATNTLNHVNDFNIVSIEDKVIELRNFVEVINNSRTNWKTAEELYKNGSYAEAMRYYQAVSSKDGKYYNKANKKNTECVEKYKELTIKSAEDYANDKNYVSAVRTLENALEVLPGDSDFESKLVSYRSLKEQMDVEDAYNLAMGYYNDEDYSAAIDVLEELLLSHNDVDSEALLEKSKKAYHNQQVDAFLEEAERYYDSEDYRKALATLDKANQKLDDSRLTDKYSDYFEAIENKFIKEAEELFATEGYEAAAYRILEGIDILETSYTLSEQYEEYMSYEPIDLSELTISRYSSGYFEDIAKDTRNNTYTNPLYLECHSGLVYPFRGDIEFLVDGAYNTFTCQIVPAESFTTDIKAEAYINIYADEKLIYTSPAINYKTEPIDVNVDIKTAKYLEIKINVETGSYGDPDRSVLVVDGKVSK